MTARLRRATRGLLAIAAALAVLGAVAALTAGCARAKPASHADAAERPMPTDPQEAEVEASVRAMRKSMMGTEAQPAR